MLDEVPMDDVYTGLAALSIVAGTVLGFVGYAATRLATARRVVPSAAGTGRAFVVLGVALVVVGGGYLAWRSHRLRQRRRARER